MRALALCAAIACSAPAQDEELSQNSYKGKAPPAIEIAKERWINAKDAIRLDKLKGRVVWLEFSFLG